MRIAVLGAGAWGTALASRAARAHDVVLWARDAGQAAEMRRVGENARYLPGVALPPALRVTSDVTDVLQSEAADLVVIATPMSGLRETLRWLPAEAPAVWLCKGFEAGSGALGHEISRQERLGALAGVLSGPSFAIEVARGQPTALVAASTDAGLNARVVDAFHGDTLRVYTSADPTGVEVGGAVKNVMAIATGILDGLAEQGEAGAGVPGLNARAALITRGLAEMTRMGVALGAQASTFMGLSGLGDLVLTATGALSRNRQVGQMLARGQSLDQVLASIGHVAEGVYSAATVLNRARSHGIEMPITQAVVEVLEGRMSPTGAVAVLMARGSRPED